MTAYTFQQLIDFTRTSAGTFVGSNGLIQTTPQSRNLLTWTQEFDNAAWIKSGSSTVVANSTTAPDGTNTADTWTSTADAGSLLNIFGVANPAGTYTVSGYFKNVSGTFLSFFVSDAGANYAAVWVNLATYAITSTVAVGTFSAASSTITAVGNGFYRLTMTFTKPVTGNSQFAMANLVTASGSFTKFVGSVFIWGAQLEQASTASDYTRNVGGLFPPRFDYDPVTLAPRGILIEEQRTNLQIRSEEFNSSPWTPTNLSTVTANSATAPDGTMTADLLVSAVGAGVTGIAITSFAFSALTYTQSVFVKAATGVRYIQLLYTSGTTSNDHANFDLQTGTVTSGTYSSASMTNFGNGWYRISMTSIATAFTSGVWIIAVPAANSVRGAAYTGNGTDGFRVWGAQLEAGAFATSYIPTVASQVTRTADQASIVAPMFAPWYNQSEGTMVINAVAQGGGELASFSDGTTANRILSASGVEFHLYVVVGGAVQANIDAGTFPANTDAKLAFRYAANDFAAVINGGAVGTDTSGTLPAVNRLTIGMSAISTAQINGHIRRVTFYPVRLSNTQLQALTA